MSDEGPPHRMPRAAAKLLSQVELGELGHLYDQLSVSARAAADALGKAGAAPTAVAFQRFEQLDARVLEIFEQIKAVLG
jgi:hypothetical protein